VPFAFWLVAPKKHSLPPDVEDFDLSRMAKRNNSRLSTTLQPSAGLNV
jgi:hypothetical protein